MDEIFKIENDEELELCKMNLGHQDPAIALQAERAIDAYDEARRTTGKGVDGGGRKLVKAVTTKLKSATVIMIPLKEDGKVEKRPEKQLELARETLKAFGSAASGLKVGSAAFCGQRTELAAALLPLDIRSGLQETFAGAVFVVEQGSIDYCKTIFNVSKQYTERVPRLLVQLVEALAEAKLEDVKIAVAEDVAFKKGVKDGRDTGVTFGLSADLGDLTAALGGGKSALFSSRPSPEGADSIEVKVGGTAVPSKLMHNTFSSTYSIYTAGMTCGFGGDGYEAAVHYLQEATESLYVGTRTVGKTRGGVVKVEFSAPCGAEAEALKAKVEALVAEGGADFASEGGGVTSLFVYQGADDAMEKWRSLGGSAPGGGGGGGGVRARERGSERHDSPKASACATHLGGKNVGKRR